MGYYEFGLHDEFNSTITGTASHNTSLYSDLGIARYLYYGQNMIFGNPWDVNIMLPFGSLTDGKIDGDRIGNASGIGDPIVSAGYWLINRPEQRQWLSAADYVTIPVGTYSRGRLLNIGGDRWVNQLQADWTQGVADKLTLDMSVDWTYYGDSDEAGTGRQKLTQTSTFETYAWLSYDVTDLVRTWLPTASNAFISVGYAGIFGGAQKIAGVNDGLKTREDQLRMTYMMFVSPTWQGLVSVSHDVNVSGGFKEGFGLTLRVAKLF